jgi:hypothetical protein
MMEMSGRYLLTLTRMLGMLRCQESEPQASTFIFIEPLKQIESLLCTDATGLCDQTHPNVRSSDDRHMAEL